MKRNKAKVLAIIEAKKQKELEKIRIEAELVQAMLQEKAKQDEKEMLETLKKSSEPKKGGRPAKKEATPTEEVKTNEQS